MFTLIVENQKGESLQLTQCESQYQIVSVAGLTPPKANLYTNIIANMQGAKFKSSRVETRNIVITLRLNGDVEGNRQNLYRFFISGGWCKVYYKNENRNVYIEGYVDTVDGDLFSISEQIQISIVCMNPYFKNLFDVYNDISKIFAGFIFPFSIDEQGVIFSGYDLYREAEIINSSDIECGMIITFRATADNISNPTLFDVDTRESMVLNLTMNAGDEVIVNTNKGQKTVTKIVNGVRSNAINTFGIGSTWMQLKPGVNKFYYSANDSMQFLNVEIKHNILYEGV